MKKLNTYGFSMVEVAILILVVGLLGAAGYVVWGSKNPDNNSPSQSTQDTVAPKSPTSEDNTYQVPSGYKLYENKQLGFKFAYPAVYGDMMSQPEENGVMITKTAPLEIEYVPGVSAPSKFTVFTYPSVSQEISSHKYEAMVKLVNDKWIVTKTNPVGVNKSPVGSEYKNTEGKTISSVTKGNLKIYKFVSADEGTTSYSYVFIANGMLHQLFIPSYYNGTFGGGPANDEAKFIEMVQQVSDSISPAQ